jgi:hypothetical protein
MESTQQVDRAETEALPFVIADNFMADKLVWQTDEFRGNVPFEHIVIDNFLPEAHASGSIGASDHLFSGGNRGPATARNFQRLSRFSASR